MSMRRTMHRTARALALVGASLVAMSAHAQSQPAPSTASGPVTPRYGDINPFYGDIQPFYGNLQPFYGDISPFWGDINPFWGDINPFYGDINPFYGDINPFWGDINPFAEAGAAGVDYGKVGDFWRGIGTSWKSLNADWGALNPTSGDYSGVAGRLSGLVDSSEAFWGTAVSKKTGLNFRDGFANAMLAKYHIDLANPSSLAALSPTDRARFLLDWYDGLMNFSGTDRVDWWMGAVHWNPALTQIQGAGSKTVIGLLDFTVTGDTVLRQNIIWYDGVSNFTNGHGAAVASLMVAAHDGQGVMGIAPGARVVAYNPFDATGTASWDDITAGVAALTSNHASVVNMSLGVRGWTFNPGWNDVFASTTLKRITTNTVFVIAAGNEGVTQTQNVPWNVTNNAEFILVGSTDAAGRISNFSNRPGEACLLTASFCLEKNKLKYRFVVAPGELILVSDDHGGTTRMSGTSFAAPMVSGAIALLQTRWPWLAGQPQASADIILRSARDLGAPGPDPVYGMGMLDITASQSPLDFSNLHWFSVTQNANGGWSTRAMSTRDVVRTVNSGSQDVWNAQNLSFSVFEQIDNTQRDFQIPLSSRLVGQNAVTANGSAQQFQAYVTGRLRDWAAKSATSGGSGGGLGGGLLGFDHSSVPAGEMFGMEARMMVAPVEARFGFKPSNIPYQSEMQLSGERASFRFGYGPGAAAIDGRSGFGLTTDYDLRDGGANPLLGLASGGTFFDARVAISPRLELSAGVTHRKEARDLRALGVVDTGETNGASTYEAGAGQLGLAWRPVQGLTLRGALTRLKESSGLLGVQSVDPADLGRGSITDGSSLGFDLDLPARAQLSATAQWSHTRAAGSGQALSIQPGGLDSSSAEIALSKDGLFAGNDHARLTLSQPMYVEHGGLSFASVQVVDRDTGETGVVVQNLDPSNGRRPLAAELLYGRPLMRDTAELGVFGRVESNTQTNSGATTYIAGAAFRLKF